MVASMRHLVPAALTVLLSQLAAVAHGTCEHGADNSTDIESLDNANAKVADWCGGDLWVLESEERDRNRELLEKAGDPDWLLDTLNSANDQDALMESFKEKYTDPNAIINDVGALGLAIALLVLHLLCCWNYLPCYRCRRKKPVGSFTLMALKFISLVLAITFCLGTLIYMANIMTYANEFSDGVSQMLCKTGELSVATLGGDGGSWPGLTGITTFLVNLNNKVASGSDFMTDLEQILTDTEEIDLAVTQTTATLRLMADTMGLAENQFPKYTPGVEAYHECYACTVVPSQVDPVVSAIEDGAAGAIQEARAEVERQLQGQALQDLRDMLCTNTETVVTAKDSFRDMLDSIMEFDAGFIEQIAPGAIAFAAIAFLIVLWACMSIACCSVCDSSLCQTLTCMEADQPKLVYVCNCCAWWCGCWTVIGMLVFGGILIALTVPTASMCVVLDDMTGQNLQDWGAAFGLAEGEGDGMWDQATSVLETCFLDSGDGDLLGNLVIDGVSLKTSLTTDLRVQIDSAFSALDDFPTESLAASQEYLDLKAAMSDPVSLQTGIKSDLVSTLFGEPDYDGIPASLQATAAQTSQGCDDATGGLSGIRTFLDEAHTEFGTGPFICNAATEPDLDCTSAGANQAACDDTQNFLTLKYQLINDATYRCDLFVDDSGSACDVLNMGASPGYANDCIKSDGTMSTMRVDCTWAEFVDYVSEFTQNNGRLDKVVARLDDAVPTMRTKIETDLQAHVDNNLLYEIEAFVNSTTCKFTQEAYTNFIDAMCYQAVASLRRIAVGYVGCAIFALFASIEAWFVFRYLVNNYVDTKKVRPMDHDSVDSDSS